ncbi:MAG: hypothetical protein K0R39_2006 [Symbiobacteriaceae bacterium]|nr:hypothetical protein [Symbiobacteriaceae bacterium]
MKKGLGDLAAAGWDPNECEGRGATVPVPTALLTNRKLGIAARVLYGLLLLTPGYVHPCGHFTYAQLADLAHASPHTVHRATKELVAAEWLQVEQANRLAPVHFQLTFPGLDRQATVLAGVQKRLERAENYGEQLMREYLSLLVDSMNFEDEAEPGFLVNPRTDERLRFDRFYPPGVAWEFNGPQHYRATERFTEAEVARQKERDYIKLGICFREGVTVVEVRPQDLSLAVMRAKVGSLLPVRSLDGFELVVDWLENESRTYQRRVARF